MRSKDWIKWFVSPLVIGLTLQAQGQTVAPSGGLATVAHLTPRQVRENTAQAIGPYAVTQKLRVAFGLKPPHMDEEKQFLEELHTKGSPNFMKFLTQKEWIARFAPSAVDEQAVVDWAQSQGLSITERYPNRLLIDVEGPVANIQRALGININRYRINGALFFSNDRDPVIPASLAGIVQSVAGLNNIQVFKPVNSHMKEPVFPDYSPGPAVSKGPSGGGTADKSKLPAALKQSKTSGVIPYITGGAYDPPDMWSSQAYDTNALYNQGHCCNVPARAGGSPPESSIAIATAGTQDPNDFQGFHNQYPYLAWHYFIIYKDGTPTCCDSEGTMDFEWSTAMSNSFGSLNDTASVFMYDGVDSGFRTFNDIYSQMETDGNARVMSTSWGWDETDVTGLVATTDNIFSQMIGEGWTLVAASGDGGASYGCRASDAVAFPASDPNVVAAGGTTLYLNSDSTFNSVTAWSGGPSGCGANDGGSTGGSSITWPAPGYQNLPAGYNRQVPDISLNADWYNTPQNIFFGGGLSGNGGTSIVAPELAGFFAQANAYLDYVGNITGGCYSGGNCAPIGNGNWYLYYFGQNPFYAPHYPFYDVSVGCNNNDVTSFFGLGYYCAGPGYDQVTGWGMFNMLQLSWAINAYRAGDFGAPATNFSGPTVNHWFNTDQFVQWTVSDTSGDGLPAVGVAGFSQAWDSNPADNFSEGAPGSGNGFYSGPQFPNATSGYLAVSWAGQGCHTANVRAWDNSGSNSNSTYGPVCYDTLPPVTTTKFTGTISSGVFITSVGITLNATDASSGVAARYYSLDGGAYVLYTAPFTFAATGTHALRYYSRDVAGNTESVHLLAFTIKSPTKTTIASSLNPSTYGLAVKFTAKVAPTFGSAVSGTVTFKDGSTTLGSGALSGGLATFTTTSLHAGSHAIAAVYAGSGNDLNSTSPVLTETVAKTTSKASLASSLNPSTYGKAVVFTATIASLHGGSVSGTVTFKDGSTTLGTAGVNTSTNKSTFTTKALAVAVHSITAVYGGSGDDSASTSPAFKETVVKAATTTALASSLNPSTHGTAVTFTATVTPAFGGSVSGTVTFKDGTVTIGKGAVNASTHKATLTSSGLSVGTHSITAVYGGDANVNISTSAVLKQTVK